jgi:guanylate kinase
MIKKKQGSIIILSAPSGAGKTAIYQAIIKRNKNTILSISYTTRKPRKSEQNGIHYFFTNQNHFKKMIEKNKFAEWALVHSNYYGTPRDFLNKTIKSGKNIILEIDVKGAMKIKKLYPQACLIFITVSTFSELKRRLLLRNQDDLKTIALRMKNAKEEFAQSKFYEYKVNNDNLPEAIKAVETIIESLKYKNYDFKN